MGMRKPRSCCVRIHLLLSSAIITLALFAIFPPKHFLRKGKASPLPANTEPSGVDLGSLWREEAPTGRGGGQKGARVDKCGMKENHKNSIV